MPFVHDIGKDNKNKENIVLRYAVEVFDFSYRETTINFFEYYFYVSKIRKAAFDLLPPWFPNLFSVNIFFFAPTNFSFFKKFGDNAWLFQYI